MEVVYQVTFREISVTHAGYKIVRVKDGKRTSAFVRDKDTHIYRKGRWTKPKKGYGPLCVFSYPWSVSGQGYSFSEGEEIWECEFEKSRFHSIWTPRHKVPKRSLMPNTILASRVKLIAPLSTNTSFWISTRKS